MKIEYFIAKRIIKGEGKKSKLSKPVINIAVWGIAIGVLIMLMAVSITTGYQKEIKLKLSGFSGDIQIKNAGIDDSYESNPIPIDMELIDSLNQDEKVKHVQVFANKAGIIKTQENMHGIILKGIDSSFNWSFFNNYIEEGRKIEFTDGKISQDALISRKISKILNLKIGDKFRVFFITKTSNNGQEQVQQKKYSFDVVGIYNTGLSEDFDSKFVIIDIKRIKKLNHWDDQTIGGYEVFMQEKPMDEFVQGLTEASFETYYNKERYIKNKYFEKLSFLDVKSIYTRYQQIINWLDYINMHIFTILFIILTVSIINMSSALLILILEKTNMIGILKSLGAKNFSIRKIFVMQAVYLIGRGLLFGNILALSIAFLQNQFQFIKLDPDTYYIEYVSINVNIIHWVAINLLTIVTCALMLLIPSIVITKISPVKAIRFN